MALEPSLIEKWRRKEWIYIEGYRSTSLDYVTARYFASNAKTDEKREVMLKIRLENKHSKYYICLDRKEYTMYFDE